MIRRFRYWRDRDEREREMREEIEEHRRQRGVGAVPSPALAMEEARAVWIPPRIESVWQDLRFGLRQLRQDRLFTFVSLFGLTLGIGLSTAVFSVIEAVYFRPLPVKEPERVVRLLRVDRDGRMDPGFSEEEMRHYRESGAMEALTGFTIDDRLVAEWPQTHAPRAIAAFVEPEFFSVLGGDAIVGRLPDRNEPGVVLLTESTWRRRLGADPGVVGRKLAVNGFPFTIAGVVADRSVAIVERSADLLLPLEARGSMGLPAGTPQLLLLGRRSEEMDLSRTMAALDVAGQRWRSAHPDPAGGREGSRFLVVPARLAGWRQSGDERRPELLLPFVVLLVLAIACANSTNLLLARAEARRREMGVRLSLGASRWRLLRQLLTECFVLTSAAGLLGLGAAQAILRTVQMLAPRYLPMEAMVPWLDLGVNGTIFGFTFGLCALTTVLFGLAPALEATRMDLAATARSGQGRAWPRHLLIMGQMAGCMVLLMMTAGLSRSMNVIDDFVSALDSKPVVQVALELHSYGYRGDQVGALHERVRKELEALPGVEAVGISKFPLVRRMGAGFRTELEIEGRSGGLPGPSLRGNIANGTLEVFRMRLLRGRDFTPAESRTAAPVAVINEPMANSLWPGANPLGRRIRFVERGKAGKWLEIVGVVAEKPIAGSEGAASYSVLEPLGNNPIAFLQVRARSGQPAGIMPEIRRTVTAIDPKLSFNVTPIETFIEFLRLLPILVSRTAIVVALAALAMAAIGLYGVTAYAAARRTKEIGVRMSLGARPGDILRLVLRQGTVVVTGGLALGSAAAVGAERALAAALALLPASPAGVYAGVAGFLGAVAVAAMMVPSLRAARVNPVVALREDG